MRFRFNLTHSIEGSLEITEPAGWKDSVLKLERDDNFHSLVEYFEGSFIFYGNNGIVNGGIEFIKNIERTYGIDETIEIEIDITFDEVIFSPVFTGQFKFADLEEMMNNKMRLPIIRDDFWSKFISRLDTPVNLKSLVDLDGEFVTYSQEVNLKLHSQKVRQVFTSKFEVGVIIPDPGNDFLDEYIQIDPPDVSLDEIKEKFTIPNTTNTEKPVWLFEMLYAGDYTFDLRIEASDHTGIGAGGHPLSGLAKVFFQLNEEAPIEFTLVDHNDTIDESSSFTYQDTLTLKATDIVRVYGFVNAVLVGNFYIWGETNEPVNILFDKFAPSGVANPSYFSVVANTIFPQTNNQGFLLHDVAAAITDRTIGQDDTFYSELLGSSLTTARQYEEDGCAWTYALLKGLQLRQYSLLEKPFFQSFSQWWAGINPILNLGLGYDEILGDQVIRVEEKSYFYLNEISIYFSNVRQITRKYDNDRIFNKVSIGYSRWQAEDISGIDDPQSRKTYSTRLQKVGKNIDLHSEFIGASLAIETTRRTTREKSADYKYDNETFIMAINPNLQEESPDVSPDLLQFTPELDENFASVTGLLNSETRYNLRITTGRNFLRWQNYLQGALQTYIGSVFRFTSAEGNYDMTSEMDINGCLNEDYNGDLFSEKGDIPVTDDFIHLADLYEAEIPMEWEEYEVIRDNRRKAIGISLTDVDHVPMFIKTLEYKPVIGTCSLLLWAKEYLDLSVTPDTTPMQECMPLTAECEDALTDENGNILTNELGVCITE